MSFVEIWFLDFMTSWKEDSWFPPTYDFPRDISDIREMSNMFPSERLLTLFQCRWFGRLAFIYWQRSITSFRACRNDIKWISPWLMSLENLAHGCQYWIWHEVVIIDIILGCFHRIRTWLSLSLWHVAACFSRLRRWALGCSYVRWVAYLSSMDLSFLQHLQVDVVVSLLWTVYFWRNIQNNLWRGFWTFVFFCEEDSVHLFKFSKKRICYFWLFVFFYFQLSFDVYIIEI